MALQFEWRGGARSKPCTLSELSKETPRRRRVGAGTSGLSPRLRAGGLALPVVSGPLPGLSSHTRPGCPGRKRRPGEAGGTPRAPVPVRAGPSRPERLWWGAGSARARVGVRSSTPGPALRRPSGARGNDPASLSPSLSLRSPGSCHSLWAPPVPDRLDPLARGVGALTSKKAPSWRRDGVTFQLQWSPGEAFK